MVHEIRALVLLGFLASLDCRADLNLTPSAPETTVDGAKITVLAFDNGGKTATYRPPAKWSYAGSASSLHLFCSGEKNADATVEKIPLAKPIAFDDEQAQRIAAGVMQALPKGCENAKLISQEKNPLKIGQKETLDTVVSYDFFGHAMQMSLLDLNMGTMLLRFKLVAERKDFEDTHKIFRGSLYSWNGL